MSTLTNMNHIKPESTKEVDYLDQDDHIRGQSYACVSFISPEEVIKLKEAYFVSAYLKENISKNSELYDGLMSIFPNQKNELIAIKEQYGSCFNTGTIDEDYKSFKLDNDTKISEQFSKEHNFQTSVRGIKIRGTYDSLNEAQSRAEVLKRKDNNLHNIYIASVGCWCPWSANPDEITDAEYTETQLNTLMREYKKNTESKEEFYQERKKDLIERTKEETVLKKKANLARTVSDIEGELSDGYVPDVTQKIVFNDEDAWTKKIGTF